MNKVKLPATVSDIINLSWFSVDISEGYAKPNRGMPGLAGCPAPGFEEIYEYTIQISEVKSLANRFISKFKCGTFETIMFNELEGYGFQVYIDNKCVSNSQDLSKNSPVLEEVTGNILDSDATYIVHQANCVSHTSSGLAKAIFDKFPYSEIYSRRISDSGLQAHVDAAGSISIMGDGISQRKIVNLFGQIYPGSPGTKEDSYKMRLEYFKRGLGQLPTGLACRLVRSLLGNFQAGRHSGD